MPRVRQPSQPTGLYYPCSFNLPLHKDLPLALPIMKGASFCFTRCQCGQNLFFPSGWPITSGLNEKQARQAGLHIITNVAFMKGPPPPSQPKKVK